MAEAIGIATSIGSILKAITAIAGYIDGLQSASMQASQVAMQLRAANATLTALNLNLSAVHRPQEFVIVWEPVAKIVLENIKVTITALNKKLGGNGIKVPNKVKLSFRGKVAWPLNREDEIILLQQLQGYLQMLALVQNGWMQARFTVVQESAENINEIMSDVGTYPLSSTASTTRITRGGLRSNSGESAGTIADMNSISSEDSRTQIPLQSRQAHTFEAWLINPRVRTEAAFDPSQYRFIATCSVAECRYGDLGRPMSHHLGLTLGPGKVTVYHNKQSSVMWIVFQPSDSESHQSRWLGLPVHPDQTLAQVDWGNDYHSFYLCSVLPDIKSRANAVTEDLFFKVETSESVDWWKAILELEKELKLPLKIDFARRNAARMQ